MVQASRAVAVVAFLFFCLPLLHRQATPLHDAVILLHSQAQASIPDRALPAPRPISVSAVSPVIAHNPDGITAQGTDSGLDNG